MYLSISGKTISEERLTEGKVTPVRNLRQERQFVAKTAENVR